MALAKPTIKRFGLVEDAVEASFRDMSYDITVGDIYVSRDRNEEPEVDKDFSSWKIEPHGMFVIFSHEKISLPADVCGYAMPKTGLCQSGILVLNTGIIDPGYSGLISGTAINFRKTPYYLKKGDPFLRLVFERVEPDNGAEAITAPQQISQKEMDYRNRILIAAGNYPATFLDIPQRVNEISARVTANLLRTERRYFFGAVAVLAMMIGLFEAFSFIVPKYYLTEEKIRQITVEEVNAQESQRRSFEEILNKRFQQTDEHTKKLIDENIKNLTEELQRMKTRK